MDKKAESKHTHSREDLKISDYVNDNLFTPNSYIKKYDANERIKPDKDQIFINNQYGDWILVKLMFNNETEDIWKMGDSNLLRSNINIFIDNKSVVSVYSFDIIIHNKSGNMVWSIITNGSNMSPIWWNTTKNKYCYSIFQIYFSDKNSYCQFFIKKEDWDDSMIDKITYSYSIMSIPVPII